MCSKIEEETSRSRSAVEIVLKNKMATIKFYKRETMCAREHILDSATNTLAEILVQRSIDVFALSKQFR